MIDIQKTNNELGDLCQSYEIVNSPVFSSAKIAFSFPDTILKDINFEIKNSNEKIAIVGRNGCGKTTLLRLISGEIEITKRDSDEDMFVAKTGNPVIGYLKQMTFKDDSVTLEEEVKKVFAPILEMKASLDSMVKRMESGKVRALPINTPLWRNALNILEDTITKKNTR